MLQHIDGPADMPRRHAVSAVFLLAFAGGRILATWNERGWDIPGGHLETDEMLLAGLRREVREEAGACFDRAIPVAMLTTPVSTKVMLFFATDAFELQELIPAADVFGRAAMTIETFLARYYGDRALMCNLIHLSMRRLEQDRRADSKRHSVRIDANGN